MYVLIVVGELPPKSLLYIFLKIIYVYRFAKKSQYLNDFNDIIRVCVLIFLYQV